jgi:class 3 adenylate cyclase
MEHRRLAVHRTIVVVDVEGFGDPRRTNRNQVAVRNGLYRVMQDAFHHAGIPWADDDHEDRGDGIIVLASAEVPKSLFVESLPSALVMFIRTHNESHPHEERIRLRMALHAGEINFDEHGATGASINLAFRLLEAAELKGVLAGSAGVLALITSSWFFEEVVRHSMADANAYHRVRVNVKETSATGWIHLPDHVISAGGSTPDGVSSVAVAPGGRLAMALRTAYTATLTKPITLTGGTLSGLQMPTLGDGYIDHRIRVAKVSVSSEPARESWWDNIPVHDDAYNFFTGYLSSPDAREAPLILLGQPGSGKSVLCRILAARLPSNKFLPIRVELRQVPAEADLQDQIEYAVRSTIGERLSWPQVVESGGGVLPVVMLDGFDELLQATGVLQTDFLLRVQAFQEREAVQGRPVAMIVTSRIAVTDRARIPDGAWAMRLEPFSEDQVTAWLKVWEQSNRVSLEKQGMRPLPAREALKYRELAEQPLLLLMLALYDAEANILQRMQAELSQTELYERLLKEFARREISKHSGVLPESDMERAVEAELLRLSVVAFAMFNRRSQWVSETDLDSDLSVLLGENGDMHGSDGPRAQLTAAQVAISRFFFVYSSQATRGSRQLRTYEFLHATFGEFLVARLVSQLLNDMLAQTPTAHSSPGGSGDALLYALLSFAALTASRPVVAFLDDLIGELDTQQRTALTDLLLRLHAQSLYFHPESTYSGYEPLRLTATTRHAAWSANLVVLSVLVAEQITSAQLFPQERDSGLAWRNHALLWRSQLAGRGWEGMYETIALKRIWDGERRGILLWRNDGTFTPPAVDIYWTYTMTLGLGGSTTAAPAERKKIFAEQAHNSILMQRKVNFVCNMAEDLINHGVLPITSSFPALANVIVILDEDRPVSATYALTAALIAPYQDHESTGKVYRDLADVAIELAKTPSEEPDRDAYVKTALAVLIAAAERGDAPSAVLGSLSAVIHNRFPNDRS